MYKDLLKEAKEIERYLYANGIRSFDQWPMDKNLYDLMHRCIDLKTEYYKRIKRKLVRDGMRIPVKVDDTVVFVRKGEDARERVRELKNQKLPIIK
tara:strand:- start:2092 stop:2379 length:288 start_codon:yes stop_codon:yes gene_type:complete